jgi:hypothetical protein
LPCFILAVMFYFWWQKVAPLSSNSCRSLAKLESWKGALFKRAMTLSKESDFRAQKQTEPEGHRRFSLFEPFDACEEGSLKRVGGEGDGTFTRSLRSPALVLTRYTYRT